MNEKNLHGKKLYRTRKLKECPFCTPGINRIGSVFHSGCIKPDMPHISDEWIGEHFIMKNCVKESGIGLSISLFNMLEDTDCIMNNETPTPFLSASVDVKNQNGIISTGIPEVSVPIRFCPMCGREIGNIGEACEGEFDPEYLYKNPYKNLAGAIFGVKED